jgi:hypothetical protein
LRHLELLLGNLRLELLLLRVEPLAGEFGHDLGTEQFVALANCFKAFGCQGPTRAWVTAWLHGEARLAALGGTRRRAWRHAWPHTPPLGATLAPLFSLLIRP